MAGPKTKKGKNAFKSRRRRENNRAELARACKTQSGPITVIKLTPEAVAEMIRNSR